jgi:DNA (cytosine-5)-methyltransferase 1
MGFELACAELGVKAKCVFSSEINKFSRQTYKANFGEEPAGDITKIASKDIFPYRKKTDIFGLFAGFPCQPFSLAGKQEGWADERNMIPHMLRVIEDLKPDFFILENVKGFKSKKFKDIYARLMWDLKVTYGYTVYEKIYNANAVVPQNRERIFFVGSKEKTNFAFPKIPTLGIKIKDILEYEVQDKYTLSDKTWACLQRRVGDYYMKKTKWVSSIKMIEPDGTGATLTSTYGRNGGAAILIPPELRKTPEFKNGFGYGIAEPDGTGRTLSARYKNDGAEILIEQKNKNPRIMTPRECARYMGFPDDFKIVVSDSQAYKQFGNAVVPQVVEYIAGSVLRAMDLKNARPHKKSRKKIEYNPLFDAALNTMRNNFLYRMG